MVMAELSQYSPPSHFQKDKMLEHQEVDAYENPTELFQHLNKGDTDKAINTAVLHSDQVKIWISSYSKQNPNHVRWRYLPLHLACLQPNPSKRLIGIFLNIYPKAAKLNDHHGFLPIHYLISEGCQDMEILDMMVDVYPKCLKKKDAHGRTMLEINKNSKASSICKRQIELWFRQVTETQTSKHSNSISNPALTSIDNRDDLTSSSTRERCFPPKKKVLDNLRDLCESPETSKKIIEMEEHAIAARKERDDLISSHAMLESQNQKQHHKIDSLTAELITLQNKLRISEESINVLKQKVCNVNKESESAICTQQSCKDKISLLETKLEQDARLVATQEEKIQSLKFDLKIVQSQKGESKELLEKLRNTFTTIQDQTKQEDDEKLHLKNVVEIYKIESIAKEKELESLKIQIKEIGLERDSLEAKLAKQVQEAGHVLSSFQKEMEKQSDTMSSYIETFSSQFAKQLEEKEGLAAKRYERICELEKQLESTRSESLSRESDLRSKVVSLQAELTSLSMKDSENKKSMGNLQNNIVSKCKALEEQNQSLLKELNEMNRLYNNEKAKVLAGNSESKTRQDNIQSQQAHEKKLVPSAAMNKNEIQSRQLALQKELKQIYESIHKVIPSCTSARVLTQRQHSKTQQDSMPYNDVKLHNKKSTEMETIDQKQPVNRDSNYDENEVASRGTYYNSQSYDEPSIEIKRESYDEDENSHYDMNSFSTTEPLLERKGTMTHDDYLLVSRPWRKDNQTTKKVVANTSHDTTSHQLSQGDVFRSNSASSGMSIPVRQVQVNLSSSTESSNFEFYSARLDMLKQQQQEFEEKNKRLRDVLERNNGLK